MGANLWNWFERTGERWPALLEGGLALATFSVILGGLLGLRRLVKLSLQKMLSFKKDKVKIPVIHLLVGSVEKISLGSMLILAGFLALQRFDLTERQEYALKFFTFAVLTVQLLVLLNDWVRYFFSDQGPVFIGKSHLSTIRATLVSVSIIAIWSFAILILLDNLGFNIAAIIAGLGVGGIAVGLALQSVFKDLIASFSIGFDRPFEVGDFIVVEGASGTVDQVGLKTTRIRSLGGELLVFPNSKLVDSSIQNYKRMTDRRVEFSFGVSYDTDNDTLEAIPQLVQECLGNLKDVRFDRAHFHNFGDYALEFQVVYYVTNPDYNRYMDIQQEFNLALRRAFAEHGIEMPFPTSSVELVQRQFQACMDVFSDRPTSGTGKSVDHPSGPTQRH